MIHLRQILQGQRTKAKMDIGNVQKYDKNDWNLTAHRNICW